jgi:hypothetical protein
MRNKMLEELSILGCGIVSCREWFPTFGRTVVPSSWPSSTTQLLQLFRLRGQRHYNPSKCMELLTQWHSTTVKNTWLLNNASVRTSNLTNERTSCWNEINRSGQILTCMIHEVHACSPAGPASFCQYQYHYTNLKRCHQPSSNSLNSHVPGF